MQRLETMRTEITERLKYALQGLIDALTQELLFAYGDNLIGGYSVSIE